jgi:zinc D-Ala-D-Ala carboxypeptidase
MATTLVPTHMTTEEVQEALRNLGWPIDADGVFGPKTFEAVMDFQRGYAFSMLRIDGHAGEQTQEALRHAVQSGGRTSPHFRFVEFKSKGNGWIKLSRDLVLGLEEYRDLVGGPVAIDSGYRDPAHNKAVGGAKNSQHLYGNAADLDPVKPVAPVKQLQRFSGIGYQGATGLVRHVDVRHIGPNTTGGTVRDPTIWRYS